MLAFKALIDPSVCHGAFVAVNNVLRKYDVWNLKNKKNQFMRDVNLFIKQCYLIV